MTNHGCRFYASYHHQDVRIRVGSHVPAAPEMSFFKAGHDYTDLSFPDIAASITVSDYAWIGGQSIILGGVTISEGAVIAAESIVTKNILPYTVAAGIPACVIKRRELGNKEVET